MQYLKIEEATKSNLKQIIVILIILLIFPSFIFAHGGNISGWKDINSDKIVESNGKYFGYHNKDGIRHFHEVKWNKEKQKWDIIEPKVYYNNKLEITSLEELSRNKQETEKVKVEYTQSVDGDTAKFKMNNEIITVRFLAIDTPESVHPTKEVEAYGIEASNYTKQKLENAQNIELEFDNNSDKKDKYNRYLAWIWVDGELLQSLLVNQGLAKVAYLYGDYKYTNILQESENVAKENKIGIWKDENYNMQEDIPISDTGDNNYNSNIENNIQEKDSKNKEILYEAIIIILLIAICIIIKVNRKRKV